MYYNPHTSEGVIVICRVFREYSQNHDVRLSMYDRAGLIIGVGLNFVTRQN